ncbi:kelch repeat-containing protein [Rhodocaloribacter sp.]
MTEATRPPMTSRRLPSFFAILLALAATACERPFVEERAPEIEIVSPDLSTVLVAPEATLRVRAVSFRPVERVTVNDAPMRFAPETGTWEAGISFERGLNTLVLSAVDAGGVERRDTVFAVFLRFAVSREAPALEVPLAGHAAALLADGSLLVTGGVSRADGEARRDAYLLPPGATRFEHLDARMTEPRTGHTATLLPDGRVLLLGGSRTDSLASTLSLVEAAEVFDPVARTFTPVPVVGEPIRRAHHTAVPRPAADGVLVDLYGGRGDVRYRPEPRLGIRDDLRGFLFARDTLFALSPAPGPLIEPVTGHTATPLDAADPIAARRFLVLGSFFDGDFSEQTHFVFDYRPGVGILIDRAAPAAIPRTLHAAVHVAPGMVLLLGGRQSGPASALDVPEVYVEPAGRSFRFPASEVLPGKRYAFTATILPSRRILLTGGFSSDGILIESEFFDLDL